MRSPVVGLLICANVLAFVVTAHGRGVPGVADLVAAGALTRSASLPGEYWRLVAAAVV